MGGMKLSDLDFVRLLPAFMRDDEAVIALSKAMNELIGTPGARLNTIRTWDKIDELNEAECDELAWELDVDWYDSTGMSLDEKRETLKLAQQIKRKRGTKWAVERLISAYFGEGYVMEWYEMDGEPFTFVALTTNPNVDEENYNKFAEAVKAAKNERSHITGVFYYWQQGPDPGIEYALGSSLHRYNFRKCGTSPRIATVGFLVKPGIETEPETALYRYNFTQAGEVLCGTYPRPGTLGAVIKEGVETGETSEIIPYEFKRKAGTYPYPGTLGQIVKKSVQVQVEETLLSYGFATAGSTTCGTYPKQATLGLSEKHEAAITAEAAFITYSFVRCGTRRCGE